MKYGIGISVHLVIQLVGHDITEKFWVNMVGFARSMVVRVVITIIEVFDVMMKGVRDIFTCDGYPVLIETKV